MTLKQTRSALKKLADEAKRNADEQRKLQAAHEKEQVKAVEDFDEQVAAVFEDDGHDTIAENYRSGADRPAARVDAHGGHRETAVTWDQREAQLRAYLDDSAALAE